MVMTRRLTKEEFESTMTHPMKDITDCEDLESLGGVLDIEPYFNSVPSSDIAPYEAHELMVPKVYRTADSQYDHVLVNTNVDFAFVVIVVDLMQDTVYGHFLLDATEVYGLQ